MEEIRKPRVLLTGFTPFGGERINPALEAVKRVRCPEAELRILEVPTVFGDSARLVTAEMDAFRPAVTPERVAINVDDARIPDNAGQQPVDAPIVPGGPAAYFATAPMKDMVQAIQEAGVPSELSNSAGTYVCNHLLYCVLHHAGPGVRAGFIHVPCIPEQTEGTERPSLPLAQLVTALEAAVSACCKG